MKSKKRKALMSEKRMRKERAANNPSGESKYARKERYCNSHRVWGFEVSEPKPWK